MALTYTTPANIDFDPESVDTVITNTYATAASATFANGAGGFATGVVQLDVALTYDQDFIATDTAHPDGTAGDLTVQAVFTEDDGTVTRTTIANGASATTIGTLGSSGNHTVGFEVTGLEEGCELSIIYNIDNNSDTKTGNITEIGVTSVTGLNGCDFQDALKYQQLNQKMNSRFDADTKEFSSFKTMRRRMKKIK
jgi:hypothetical protein